MSESLDAATLRKLFRYEPETGRFIRLTNFRQYRAGEVAGYATGNGYIKLGILGGLYFAHRLAWLWVTGEWPPEEIDHINGIGTDNRWANLRLAIGTINRENLRRAHRDSRTGFLGVTSCGRGKFRAMIRASGRTYSLGEFTTAERAYEAYVEAKRRLHEGCTI